MRHPLELDAELALRTIREECGVDANGFGGYTRSDVIVVTAAEVAAARSYSNGIFDLAQHVANLLTLADRKAGREAPAYGYSAENFARAEAMIASA